MATELAKAYVQIVPSARGIQGGIGRVLDPEAGSAGESAGRTFGGKMLGKIKGLIATAAIGKAIGDSLAEGGALQQSIGGVETLFKGSADVVKAAADNAFRTAGLSANQYMETVTGFSASLLQSLGGDTAKAASAADMAITDMADNVNKMGGSMESIQNAYAGFAKQNYTMLDNLKLGYGGTKQEMERLLADAEKFSGVKYDIDNLNDVYSAIHVVQGEMEISGRTAEEAAEIYKRTGREVSAQLGTTAKEAATTLQGSKAAMQGAFKNVLGNLALGEDIRPSLEALVESTSTFLFGNLVPMTLNIIKAIPAGAVTLIRTAVPELIGAVMELIPQLQTALSGDGAAQLWQSGAEMLDRLVDGIFENLPTVLQGGSEILGSVLNGILLETPKIAQSALDIVVKIGAGLLENMPQILESGKTILLNLMDGLRQALPQLLISAGEAVIKLISGLIQNLPKILAAGYDLLISLIEGIGKALPDIVDAAFEVAGKLKDTLAEVDWLQLGKDLIQGVIDGISAMAGALWDAACNVAKAAMDGMKSFLGINSPSKRANKEVGRWVPPGVGNGMEENLKPMLSSARSVADSAVGTLQQEVSAKLAAPVGIRTGGYSPAAAGGNTNMYMTIYSRDSLSESELTREAEDMLSRMGWKNP